MAAPNKSGNPKKNDDKLDQLLGDIVYSIDLPEVSPDCKFLPFGKELLEYAVSSESFPELESQDNFYFDGIESFLNLNLLNQEINQQPSNEFAEMDHRDSELLKDLKSLIIKYDEK